MTSPIDASEVLGSLKDFQRSTAEWVFHRMFDDADPAVRFLVADEVGLGKTHVAKGVVAQVIQHLSESGDKRHDIVYVCSNGAIARQNLRKLVPKGIEPLDSVDRLTMLPLAQLEEGSEGKAGINLLAITPGTSLKFGRSTGMFRERALAYSFLRELWGSQAFPARARWLFWEGVGDGDARLQAHAKAYRKLIARQLPEFRQTFDSVDEDRRAQQLLTLREVFDSLVEDLAWKREFPEAAKARRAELIGSVRKTLATVGIAMLQPDLVILDEFQRFKDLLHGDANDFASSLAKRLFTHTDSESGRPTRTLLLSATPYRMYTAADETEGDHYADFIATCDFLFDGGDAVPRLESNLRALRSSITRPGGIADAERHCADVASDLRRVMVRTERLAATPDRDGMLSERPVKVTFDASELRAFLRIGDLAAAVDHSEPTELWKSSPYLFNFMSGYKLKEALSDALELGDLRAGRDLLPGPGLLNWDDIEGYQLVDPQNGRLRWLIDDLHAHDAFELLWLPPSIRYYDAETIYEREPAMTFTKRLIFSGWTVVPRVVSSLVSFEAERVAHGSDLHRYTDEYGKRGGGRLDFRLDNRKPAAMTSFLFVWPSPTLAELGDPRPRHAGQKRSVREVLDQVEGSIAGEFAEDLRSAPTDGPVDERWYWAAPLLLDKRRHPEMISDWFGAYDADSLWTWDEVATGFRRHADEAWRFLEGDRDPLGRVPTDLTAVLAEVAVGGPAVCALRAIAAVAGLPLASGDVLSAGANIGWSVREYFNAPDVTALVVRQAQNDPLTERQGRARYWQDAVRHCIGGNLQAVLDEHAHVLRDWLGFTSLDADSRLKMVEAVADQMVASLGIRTSSLTVDIPQTPHGRRSDGRSLRTRFAVAFGDQRLEDGGEGRVESISGAFNSPFWPFVLTSTMLLWMSRGDVGVEVGLDGGVDLSGDVALEAADDVFLGLALLGASFDVDAGAFVVAEPAEDDAVEGGVGGSVAAAVEPEVVLVLA